jgi:hypothetical protein
MSETAEMTRLRSTSRLVTLSAAVAVLALGWPRVTDGMRMPIEVPDVRSRIVERLTADLSFVRTELDAAPMTLNQRAALRASLVEAEGKIGLIPAPDLARFTTVLPLNATHAEILAVHGAILAAKGLPPLVVWKGHRYDAVPLMATPSAPNEVPSLDITMMANEYRADAVLLTNATYKAIDAAVRVANMPGSPRPDWLQVSAVEWTDTLHGTPVADALPNAAFADGAFRLTVPAGMTRKVWLTVDGSKVEAGTYHGTLTIGAPRAPILIPFTVRVSRVTMGRPRLSLGMWDYTNGAGAYGITLRNRDAAIALMRSHFVDSPWATRATLPWPVASDYDANGRLVTPLDFHALDEWIRIWPDARRFYIFAAVDAIFAGASMSAPDFVTRLAEWARAVAQHATALGLVPRQLGLMLVDEPHDDAQNAVIAAWARVLKSAAPEIDLFEDPIWPRPDRVSPADAFTLVDELCFQLAVYSRGGEPVARYFEGRREAGQRLWMYQTRGPARLLDPTTYFRMAGWHAFRLHAVGSAFWSFGDTGGSETSWNDYAETRIGYSPAFIGRQDVTDSLHWQAVREGVEDYEYLAMLRDAAATARDPARKAQGLALIDEAVKEVRGVDTDTFEWEADSAHARSDAYRLRILSMLESLQSGAIVVQPD